MTNPFEGLPDEEDMDVIRRENQPPIDPEEPCADSRRYQVGRFLAETTPPLDEEEEIAVVLERLRRIRHRLAEARRQRGKED